MAANGHKLLEGRDENGIPLKSSYDNVIPAPKSIFVAYSMFFFIFASFGVAMAALLYYVVKPAKSLEKITLLVDYELGSIYIALFFMQYFYQMINANLGTARRVSRVNVPDQHVYRVYGGPANGSTVLMDCEGDNGRFNRGQRSFANLQEWLPAFLVSALAVGFVFPHITACIVVLFGAVRLWSALGYVESTEGREKGGMLGFLFVGLLNGCCIFLGCLAIYREYFS